MTTEILTPAQRELARVKAQAEHWKKEWTWKDKFAESEGQRADRAEAERDSLKAQLKEDAKDAHSTGYSDGYRFGLEDAAKVADGYGVDGTHGFDTHRTTADAIAIEIRALATQDNERRGEHDPADITCMCSRCTGATQDNGLRDERCLHSSVTWDDGVPYCDTCGYFVLEAWSRLRKHGK